MSKTNCINCGAAKDVDDRTCPFCGTKYADFTTFDMMHDDTIYIQLKSGENVITAKAYITDRVLEFHPKHMALASLDGRCHRVNGGTNVTGNIGFVLYENI